MARHPEQALYTCNECNDGEWDAECWRCGGAGYLLWEDLEEDEQDMVRAQWEESLQEEAQS